MTARARSALPLLLIGLATLTMVVSCVTGTGSGARYADFGNTPASAEARHVADWVSDSRDSAGHPFIIVDKKLAVVHVFDGKARLRGSSAVLLGSAKGDETVRDIGSRPIAEVLPHERTTPAGRFVAERGSNLRGENVTWLDYDSGLSMHPVLTRHPAERRLQRLATPTVTDNRISYGCVNVPAAFYKNTVHPVFAKRRAIVYVLPEVRSVQEVFGSYDVDAVNTAQASSSLGDATPYLRR